MSGTPYCVLVGQGPVGRMFTALLRGARWRVDTADTTPAPGVTDIVADIGAPTAELRDALTTADLVLLAVPERAALAALPVLARHTDLGATVADTLSSKGRYLDAAATLAPRPLLSLNPLFHPSLGWRGQAVAACPVRTGELAARVLALVEGAGARVRLLDGAEHDRYLAALQTTTHAAIVSFARAVARLGLPTDVIDCAPPPTRLLLALAARVLGAQPETYWDIQRSGETAAAARKELAAALAELDSWTGRGDEAAFRTAFAELTAWYGPGLDAYASAAARALAAQAPPEPSTAEEQHR